MNEKLLRLSPVQILPSVPVSHSPFPPLGCSFLFSKHVYHCHNFGLPIVQETDPHV